MDSVLKSMAKEGIIHKLHHKVLCVGSDFLAQYSNGMYWGGGDVTKHSLSVQLYTSSPNEASLSFLSCFGTKSEALFYGCG